MLLIAGFLHPVGEAESSGITPQTTSGNGKTLGLVITVWDSAIYETPDAQECPEGLQYGEMDQWLAMSEAQRLEQNRQFGFRWNRGPNGENGITAPGPIKDT